MNQDKNQILEMLTSIYQRWEDLLGSLSEAQITDRQLPEGWSIKDVMAHLMTWQQRSIARLEAGLHHCHPVFPPWPEGFEPEEEDPVDVVNAWIYANHRDRPWADVYRDWKTGFLRFIELGKAMPEEDLLTVGRYPWLKDYPLAIVLTGSFEHHEEHLDLLREWMRKR